MLWGQRKLENWYMETHYISALPNPKKKVTKIPIYVHVPFYPIGSSFEPETLLQIWCYCVNNK